MEVSYLEIFFSSMLDVCGSVTMFACIPKVRKLTKQRIKIYKMHDMTDKVMV